MNHSQALRLESDIDDLVALGFQTLNKLPIKTDAVHRAVDALGKPADNAFLRKRLVWFMNSFLGIAEELSEGSLTLVEAKGAYQDAAKFFRSFTKDLIDNNTVADRNADDDEGTAQLLGRYKRTQSVMQSHVTQRGLFFDLAPVLPMVAFDRSKLQQLGIASANMQGYTILESQYVLGISLAKVEAMLDRDREGLEEELNDVTTPKSEKTDIAKRLKALNSAASIDAKFAELLEVFQSKHRDLILVAERPVAWWEARWYWLAKPKTLGLLRTATFGGGKFAVQNWGFPFQSSLSRAAKPVART